MPSSRIGAGPQGGIRGPQGDPGPQGPPGVGGGGGGSLPSGGSTNQLLGKNSDTDGDASFKGLETIVHAATSKTTPADGDEIFGTNSASSYGPVKFTILAIKNAVIAALTKTSVGLANVDNTSDANKPVSAAQQAAIDNAVGNRIVFWNTSTNSWPARPTGSARVLYDSTSTTGVTGATDAQENDRWDLRT